MNKSFNRYLTICGMNLTMVIMMLGLINTAHATETTQSEFCAVAMSQFRYYAHGYETGAKWVPGSDQSPKYDEKEINPEGVIIDYYIAKDYLDGSAQLTKTITRNLIHTAYDNYKSGHSSAFGSYWTLASCMGFIDKPIQFLGRCDRQEVKPTQKGFKQFLGCAS
ncbi:hypothetical protein L5M38_21610 [Shewanella sp. SM101]|uniref:hypothetical protein n=1 Tax=Shewanella TaxID=22 RepID=UPI0021D8D4E9|nr:MULTISPECIES: hypothetical protein [unclassified Shewanella]MCU8009953.1 hypothetical protein [Shewanella sp. SM87]MCU8107109.1 hypothetical protein [Shewanella sp. SM101]